MRRNTKLAIAAFVAALLPLPGFVVEAAPADGTSVPAEVSPIATGPDSTGVLVAQGTLRTTKGAPTGGRVAALAWPNEDFNRTLKIGDIVAQQTVGWAQVRSDGTFALRVSPDLIPATYINQGDTVNLTLVGWGNGTQGDWDISASIGGQPIGASVHASNLNIAMREPLHSRLSRPPNSAAIAAGLAPSAGGCYEYFVAAYDIWDVMGETWPWGPHTADMVIQSGHSHTMGVAVSASGAYGTFSASGSSSVSTSVSDDFGFSTLFRNYQMQTRYGRFNGPCGGTRMRPLYTLGYFQNGSLSGYPNWTHCGPAVGQWIRSDSQGSSYSATGGVKIAGVIGINLDSSTNYATTRTMTYYYSGPYHVCGNDAPAGLASKVESAP